MAQTLQHVAGVRLNGAYRDAEGSGSVVLSLRLANVCRIARGSHATWGAVQRAPSVRHVKGPELLTQGNG